MYTRVRIPTRLKSWTNRTKRFRLARHRVEFALFGLCLVSSSHAVWGVDIQRAPNPNAERFASALAQQPYNRLMSTVHKHVVAESWQSAERTLLKAIEVQPKAIAAQDLLDFIRTQLKSVAREGVTEQLQRLLATEQWQDIMKIGSTLTSMSDEQRHLIERATAIVALEENLDRLLKHPPDLARPSIQPQVEQIRSSAERLELGPKVNAKYNRFAEVHEQWTTALELVITSDNRTAVTIRPGQSLGKFRSKRIRLRPGEYELIGQRQGYREVRQKLSLLPNEPVREVAFAATERF